MRAYTTPKPPTLNPREVLAFRGPASRYGTTPIIPALLNELLAAVDVVCRPGERGVAHDVNGECGNVRRLDDTPDGQRRPELGAPLIEIAAED